MYYNFQSTLFLLAGFDTTSTAITMAAYSLAMHPDIQERLHSEISEAVETHVTESFIYCKLE